MADDRQPVPIAHATLAGLRDAYIAFEIERENPRWLVDRLTSWIDGVLEEAGMIEEVRVAVQENWKASVERARKGLLTGRTAD